jgi:hypothetical protein
MKAKKRGARDMESRIHTADAAHADQAAKLRTRDSRDVHGLTDRSRLRGHGRSRLTVD